MVAFFCLEPREIMEKESYDYLEINKKAWNSRVEDHMNSDFYDLESFINGNNPLKSVELELLGDIAGKTLLHLQCHFGMDTLALARLGANVTGLDFSSKAIEKARELCVKLQIPANFVCCDVYSKTEQFPGEYDLVFTSYGTIGWLPDLKKWAQVVYDSLKPGGKFVMVDFHPVVWMFDESFRELKYSYFNHDAIVETEAGSYAHKSGEEQKTIGWNHSLGEILGSLINTGLTIKHFEEHDFSPYPCFNKLEKDESGNYRISGLSGKIPMLYSIVCNKTK